MECKAYQASDQMYCKQCAIAWDMNDPNPPVCGQVIKKIQVLSSIFIEYEVANSWWASYIPSTWLRLNTLASKYFAWKFLRKYKKLMQLGGNNYIERLKQL